MRLKIFFCFLILLFSSSKTFRYANASAFKPADSKQSSLNWAGYVSNKGNFNSITGTWIIPKISASGRNYKMDAAWVGIGGVNSSDLIQAGTEAVSGVPGKVGYLAWYELLPDFAQPVSLAVQAGDSVTVSINRISGLQWQVILKNNTSGSQYSKNLSYNSSLSSAEWIEEMPSDSQSQLIPLDNFKMVRFSSGFVRSGRTTLSIAKSGALPVTLESSKGKILAVPSVLQDNGSAFEVKRMHG